MNERKLSSFAKGITGSYEAILAIPFLGGSIILLSGWQALSIAFTLHVIALLISLYARTSALPSIMGIIASIAGYIPVIGWFFHAVAMAMLLTSAYSDHKQAKTEASTKLPGNGKERQSF